MRERLSRRALLAGGLAAAGAAGAAAVTRVLGADPIELPAAPVGLPVRQHAWNDRLTLDEGGNPQAPQYHRMLLFGLTGAPGARDVRLLEASLRSLERSVPWDPQQGVLSLVGWGPGYLRRHADGRYDLPRPEPLSSFETPELEDLAACLHLAADDEQRLVDVEDALVRGEGPLGAQIRPVGGRLEWRQTRTGFTGAGLPAARQDVGGIPASRPVPGDSPLFMGYKSGFRRNQATEDDVTIDAGPLAGGTTMHVSRLRLRLESWYQLFDDDERAARMFAPQVSDDEVDGLTNEAPTHAEELTATARERGVVGHLQASATARRDGRPLILRRDFNTTDDDQAGLHFVALQREIADFVATRQAMNAARAPFENASIDARVNNGIKEFIFVTHRANFVVPPRSQRSFPLLPGRDEALA